MVCKDFNHHDRNCPSYRNNALKGTSNVNQPKQLLFSKEEFDELEKYCIGENYSSPYPTEMGKDVRFADFTEVKDIILKNGSLNMMIFNDYEKEVSTLIIFVSNDNHRELGRVEYNFTSIDEFCSKLSEYKSYLSAKNGTIQVIEWIINNCARK